jgi:hypothetical protein
MLILSIGALTLVPVGVAFAASPSPMKNTRANKHNPAAYDAATGARWLAWSRNSAAHPGRFHHS